MKIKIAIILIASAMSSCNTNTSSPAQPDNSITGTWVLISGTTILKEDTTVADYTKDQQMIKIINNTHFAFMRHDLNNGKDSSKAIYSSGGGRYSLTGDQYTEYLDYCNDREWEGHTFNFTVTVNNDTLTQQGIEKIEKLDIDRLITEKYIRVKN
ncbi:MAG: hypothetical protein ACXWWC_15020 [Chitinophagaceae bacterium]